MSSEPLEIREMQCRNSNCPPGTTRKHQVFVPLLLGPRHLENPCRRIEVGGSFRGHEPETGRSQFGSRRRAVKRIFWFLNGLREGPRIGPGSHSILRVKWDAGIGPRRIGLEGSWAPAVGLEGFDGRSEPTIIGVLPTGGVLIPPGPTAGQK